LAEDRLTASDKRALVLWILCGIVGAWFAHRYFFQAFPEASVDFKVSRVEVQSRAKAFLQGLGEDVSEYQSTIVFDVDENAKTYLEREMGLQQANRLMAGQLSIWYWDVRFFRPQQEEEFLVRVSPAGQVVGYEHKIAEARAEPALERGSAIEVASKFAAARLGVNLDQWNFLDAEANSQTRPNRVDWSFTWEKKEFKAKGAPYRLQVELQGNQIGGSQKYLQVPEAWTRDYQHLRSTNNFYGELAIVPYGFLLGAALWLGISLWRQGKTSWGTAFAIGVVVAFIYLMMELNDWGSVRAGYDTHFTYASFVLRAVLSMVLGAVGTAITISLVYPGGEPLYRASQPDKLRLTRAFSLRGMRSKEFFNASVVGISLAAVHVGFITAFYMIGSKVGVWAPQDIQYSDIVNTPFPWIAGVAIGVLAATNEEFTFRLFAIPFLQKLTGSRVLAVILPAFFWSFLHSNYPQEPGYIRGIEVGIMGIVAGLVMLRWGIAATLIWHYTVDASLVGMLLIRSDNLYFKISGLVVALAAVVPLVYCGVTYLRRERFESVEDLLNRAEPAGEISLARSTAQEPVAVSERKYVPLSTGVLGFLAICVVLGAFCALRLKREHIGDSLELSVDRKEVTARADAVMREHGLDPGSFYKAAQMVDTTSPITNEYLRRRISIAEINAIYDKRVPGALWRVRYFHDAQPEEFAVTVRPDGTVHAFWHTLAEAAKGANLSKEDAQAIAEKYLREKKQIDLSGWKLVEANSDKRPNRTDHTLVWQQNTPLDASSGNGSNATEHAYARMSVQVLGDEPADFRTYIKIPEEFERQQQEQSLARTLFLAGQIVLALALAIAVLTYFFKRVRTQPVRTPWKRFFGWGMVGLAGYLLAMILGRGAPAFLSNYPTTMPLSLFLGSIGIGVFLGGAFLIGAIALVFGLAWTFGARAFGEEKLPGWLGMPPDYYRDAFWIGIGGAGLLIGVRHLLEFVSVWWPTLHRGIPSSFGNLYDMVLPGAGALGGAVVRGMIVSGIILLGGAFLGAELRARWLRLLLFVAIAAALVMNWGSPADFLKQFLASMILFGVVVYGMRVLARFNLLGLFLTVTGTILLGSASELLAQPNRFYRANGYAILAVLVVSLLWPLAIWRRGARTSAA